MSTTEIESWILHITKKQPHLRACALSEIHNGNEQHLSAEFRREIHLLADAYPGLLPAVLRLIQWTTLGTCPDEQSDSDPKEAH